MSEFSHINEQGEARMVDITDKDTTSREASAQAVVQMNTKTIAMIINGDHHKGDVIAVARVAGIMAAKKCADLIPLCHPLALSSVTIEFNIDQHSSVVNIISTCKLSGKTGVEMEALTAANVAALTLYDMCKAVDKKMVITEVKVLEKRGGKSGDWHHDYND